MYDLENFKNSDMFGVTDAFQKIAAESASLEETANKIVRFLFSSLTGPNGKRGCALVRLYKTHPYGELSPPLQAFAQKVMGQATVASSVKCLTLLATAGIEPEWNSRKKSNGHQAIPLYSAAFIQKAPMVLQLLKQFGLDLPAVVAPSGDLISDLGKKEFNIFHVPQAKGSPFIPAQDNFVIPYKVQSVFGFGGMLGSGDIIAAILFTQVPVSKEVAEKFRPVGPVLAGLSASFIQHDKIFAS